MLLKITEKIASGIQINEILDFIYDSFRSILPYERIGMASITEDQKTVRLLYARSEAADIRIGPNYSAPLQGSSLEKLFITNRPRILNDLPRYLQEHPQSASTQLIVDEGMRSSLTCPLIATGKRVGFLFYSSIKENAYKDALVETYLQIANQVSMAIEKSLLYQQLIELNALKNKFISMAAHDIRNPVTTIGLCMDVFLDGYFGEIPKEQRDLLLRAKGASEYIINLVSNILDYGAMESGKCITHPEATDVKRFLQECLRSDEIFAKTKAITFGLDAPPELPMVDLDPNRIKQVLSNLVTNAIKYSQPGTHIAICVAKAGEVIKISIADQGQGISQEGIGKLFRPFSKAESLPTGGEKSTGLGLYIAKNIVETHGGKIWVTSAPGKGATFFFTLPIENKHKPHGPQRQSGH